MQWTPEKLKYFKDNYYTMPNKEISKAIGIQCDALSKKAKQLNLPNKKGLGLPRHKYIKQIPDNDFENPMKEQNGRQKMLDIQNIKKSVYTGKAVKVEIHNMDSKGRIKTRFLKGKIISKTDVFIVLQSKNYRECFNYTDIFSKRVVLEG